MRAISLWQPWATALFYPDIKAHETRGWACHPNVIGQRIAIHAAGKPISNGLVSSTAAQVLGNLFGSNWRKDLPRGVVLGTIQIVDCRCMDASTLPAHDTDRLFGDWKPGRYAWRVADPLMLAQPIPWKGKQGWFQVPDDLFELVQP